MNIPCKACPIGGGEPKLPVGYIRADFLESTGTQYIYTNVRVTNNTGCAIAYTRSALYNRERYLLFIRSLKSGGGTNNFWCPPCMDTAGLSWIIGFGSRYRIQVAEQIPINTRFDVLHNYKNSSKAQINGETVLTFDRSLYTEDNYPENPLVLFGFVNADLTPWRDTLWQGKVYYCYMTEETQETRRYIPAISPDGTPCMYDTVTKKPFYNSGSGSFIVGLTKAQAMRLSSLPPKSTATTLKISLPASILDSSNNVIDTEVKAAMDKAEANGWKFSITSYTS